MTRIRVNGGYIIRSAESRPGRVNAAIAAATASAKQPKRSAMSDDLALARAVQAAMKAQR